MERCFNPGNFGSFSFDFSFSSCVSSLWSLETLSVYGNEKGGEPA